MSPLSSIGKKFHKAAEDGDLEKLKKIASNRKFKKHWVNSKDQDKYQRTPLHKASISNHLEIVKFLIQLGANVNAKAVSDWTPLLK